MAVAGRAAGVGVEHEEAGVREDVERPEKRVAIGAVRAAVDRQHEWVFTRGVEVGWLHEPSLDLERVGVVPEFLDLTQRHAVKDVRVHLGQACRVGRII